MKKEILMEQFMKIKSPGGEDDENNGSGSGGSTGSGGEGG